MGAVFRVPLQTNSPWVLAEGHSYRSSSMGQSLPLEGGGVECGDLCHNEIKGLGRMSFLGSQKEPFSSFLFWLEP